jgi:acyl carrier protein
MIIIIPFINILKELVRLNDQYCLMIGQIFINVLNQLANIQYIIQNNGQQNMTNKLTTESEKLEFLNKSLSKLFDKNFKVSIDDNLYNIGLDSLDIIELQVEYEETFNVEFPDTLKSPTTVRDLINLM